MNNKREHKGNSLLEFVSDYVVLDVETTDFDYFYGDIIEIGIKKYVDFKEVDSYETFVNSGKDIPFHITNLTGISNEDITSAPYIHEIANDVVDFIGDNIIVAHHANFDINFLYDSLINLGFKLSNDFIDTLRLSRILLKEMENHKLKTLANNLNLSKPGHRAIQDVLSTNDLYKTLNSINETEPNKLIEFINRRKKNNSPAIDFSSITATTNEFDEEHQFYGKHFCFTGRMDVLTKAEASQIVANLGGINQNNVTAKTDILVLGNLEYQQTRFGKKSSKHLKAEKMQNDDHHIEILTELSFLEIIQQ